MSEEIPDYVEEEEGLYDYDEAQGEGDVHPQYNPEDVDIAEAERRIQELSEEQEQVNKLQSDLERQISSVSGGIEENSIYIGQVDYEATVEELKAHFAACGTIHRVTILCDKFTGRAKGFAYIEFVDKTSVENALKLDETPFKGRNLKVLPKRHNEPKFMLSGGRGGGRGGGRFYRGRGGMGAGGYRGRGAGRRGGFRGGWGGGGRGRGGGGYY